MTLMLMMLRMTLMLRMTDVKDDSDSVGSVLWYLKDIKKDVTTIKADVKTNSETLAAHSVSISALEKGLEDLKKEQKSDNEKLRKEKKEENEKFLTKIDTRFEDFKKEQDKRFDGVDSDHKKLAEKVNEIYTDQKVLTANFANLEKTVSDLKDVVSSNFEKLTSNSEKLSDLQNQVSTQKTAIDGIGGTLKTINTKVDAFCVDMAVIKEKVNPMSSVTIIINALLAMFTWLSSFSPMNLFWWFFDRVLAIFPINIFVAIYAWVTGFFLPSASL
uniref:Uncharacterized protein n=1 Tax=Meloidogyne incognita TaxID=6306 RepID=A0A914MBX5_MELIC